MQPIRIQTDNAPKAIGPYSQGISVGDFVFCSGQVGFDPASGQFAAEDVQGQTRQALQNLSGVLGAAGSNLDQVIKTTVFLSDMANFQAMNEVYAEFFPGTPPARSTVAVRELPRQALVEIEAIAVKK